MIFKKIKNLKPTTKRKRIFDLTSYILSPENSNQKEKCVYSGARGFLTDDTKSNQHEMLALAESHAKSSDPISHYLISWKENEQPSHDQIEEIVTMFEEEFGLVGHQIIFGLHDDTDNLHLHIAVNRVNPETERTVRPNGGWDIDAGHQLVAKICAQQGWEQEQNCVYECLENGEVYRIKNITKKSTNQDKIKIKTGAESAQNKAASAARILEKSESWQDLHRELELLGMRFEPKGSGAVIFVGDIAVKASSVSRNGSLGKLQKRLGEFRPFENNERTKYYEHRQAESPNSKLHLGHPEAISGCGMRKLSECHLASDKKRTVADFLSVDACADRRTTRNLRRQSSDSGTGVGGNSGLGVETNRASDYKLKWDTYVSDRKNYQEKRQKKLEDLKSAHEKERNELFARQKEYRNKIFAGSWKGKGKQLNALRSLTAHEQASVKLEMRERHKAELSRFRQVNPPFPDFDDWMNGIHPQGQIPNLEGAYSKPEVQDLRLFQGTLAASFVHYAKGQEQTSFVDRGRKIDVLDTQAESVLAAMQLASQKWGGLQINGDDGYKNLCVELAATHGFKILNPELQERLRHTRARLQREKQEAKKNVQLKLFEKYSAAVGADRYRVTSIRMFQNGDKKAFILDKRNGVTKGFTSAEMTRKMSAMLKMQARGENIYYTPLSDAKHHILIDDMSKESVQRLVDDGYKPAVLLESSPGNYQCIITIPKLNGPHDKDVGNRLTERMNKEYGDPNLSGCIHPHRAPGFDNRKPKHQKADGSFPAVRLLKAQKRECPKCLELAKEIQLKYENLANERVERQKQLQTARRAADIPGSPTAAYIAHLDNIRQHLQIEDRSRVDAMIAIRMRATGHSQDAVESAIRQCAPDLRENESRNWDRYAERTAEYAFGLKGDETLQRNERYAEFWKRLEGRETSSPRMR